MTEAAFVPTIYFKEGCPFCLKVRIFMLEARLLDTVQVREFAVGSDEEQAIRTGLAPHFEKISFSTVMLAPGEYLSDSDAIIARFAGTADVDPAKLPTFRAYSVGVMPQMMSMYRENMELKKRLA